MPKVKDPLSKKLRDYVKDYGDEVFSTDGQVLFCKMCSCSVSAEKKFSIDRHIDREKHKNMELFKNKSKSGHQALLMETIALSPNIFFQDLCEAFMSADIPLAKLNNVKLKSFLEKTMGKAIPDCQLFTIKN